MPQLPQLSISLLGGARHAGGFATGSRFTYVALVGGVDLDLHEATLPPEGLTVTKASIVGGVSLVVPPGVRVEVSGLTIIGGRRVETAADVPPGAPVVRVRAFGFFGGVKVRVAR